MDRKLSATGANPAPEDTRQRPSAPGHQPAAPAPGGRLGVLWQLLGSAFAAHLPAGAQVLDCGGGSGAFAVPLAALGHQVTVLDISPDALAALAQRAAEQRVDAAITGLAEDVDNLAAVVGSRQFGLVLAHEILSELEDPAAAVGAMAAAVRPGGLLSVLIDNPVAGVLARALSGDLPGALAELHALGGHENSQAGASQVASDAVALRAALERHGLVIDQVNGIGVFSDLVPGRALDSPEAGALLAELETAAATRPPFADIATRVHLLARRPG